MSMLADPRRKQKISADPRNLAWQNDENKFGKKLMEKMGWSDGTGLGAKGTGNLEPIKVHLKADTRGVGCTKNYADNWIAHQDDFNSLLASLNAGSDSNVIQDAPVQKLEEKAKKAKSRVHYMKFAKGKDLSMKTATDLDCIFGKRKSKSAPTTPQTHSAVNSGKEGDSSEENMKTEESIVTFNSTSNVQDYFAKKMAALKRMRTGGNQDSVHEDVRNSYGIREHQEDTPKNGFGFVPASSTDASWSRDTSCDVKMVSENESENRCTEEKPKKRKKKDKKRKAEEENNDCPKEVTMEDELPETSSRKKKAKKRKREKAVDESEWTMADPEAVEGSSKKKEKRRKEKVEKQMAVKIDGVEASPNKGKLKQEQEEEINHENESSEDGADNKELRKTKKKKAPRELKEKEGSNEGCGDEQPRKKRKTRETETVPASPPPDGNGKSECSKDKKRKTRETETVPVSPQPDGKSECSKDKKKNTRETETVPGSPQPDGKSEKAKDKKNKRRKSVKKASDSDNTIQWCKKKRICLKDTKMSKIMNNLKKKTRKVVVTQVAQGDLTGCKVLTWVGKDFSTGKVDKFCGSNFEKIKGYGHGFDPQLTLMPISQRNSLNCNNWKRQK